MVPAVGTLSMCLIVLIGFDVVICLILLLLVFVYHLFFYIYSGGVYKCIQRAFEICSRGGFCYSPDAQLTVQKHSRIIIISIVFVVDLLVQLVYTV